MFAATLPNTDRVLETFKLGLLLESKKQDYPPSLKDYFREVINQSLALADRPEGVAASPMPEAVNLALKFTSNEALREALSELFINKKNASELAKVALKELESTFDTNRESTHFSAEIYAAI